MRECLIDVHQQAVSGLYAVLNAISVHKSLKAIFLFHEEMPALQDSPAPIAQTQCGVNVAGFQPNLTVKTCV